MKTQRRTLTQEHWDSIATLINIKIALLKNPKMSFEPYNSMRPILEKNIDDRLQWLLIQVDRFDSFLDEERETKIDTFFG